MADIVVADSGRVRKLSDVELAEDVLKAKNSKDTWSVIDKLVKAWAARAPEDVKAIEINLGQYRESLKDKEFGTTTGAQDQERRFKLSFPYALMMMIRSVYKHEDLKMDEKWFDEFAKRYPYFKVAEK